MENNIKDKVILITGASSGIGNAIAKKLAENGANIILFGGRNKDKLISAENEIKKFGVKTLSVAGDITDSLTVDNGIKKVLEVFNKVEILINNAGIGTSCAFSEVTEKLYDDIMNLDVKAPFFLTQKLLPTIKKSNYATIVNISSSVGHIGYELQSAYSMAKHAVIGFSQSLARELYKENVRVFTVSPGGVYTDMIKKTRPDLTGDDMIMPEDIANTVAFLLANRTNAVIDEIQLHRVGKPPFSM
ncbi:MAG: SDR family oxidoreductase [Clostridia bacterium]|nr:SDR family oxidoreductase [Clostridia bacterium]